MIRHASETDLPRILTIYDGARQYMRRCGNMCQWINGYPSPVLLRQDIADGSPREAFERPAHLLLF